MVNSAHLDCVTSHINQTHLVDNLLKQGFLNYDDIEGWHAEPDGDYPDIYQWLVFPHFWEFHYEKLVEANIPVLDSDFGTWIGITSFGSPYTLYVYPSLINAIFGDKAHGDYVAYTQQKTA